MLSSKEMRCEKNDPNYEEHKWVDTSAPEIRALFGINIMMGINSLPQYKMYWHKDMFLGNDGIKRTMPISSYEKLTQYLHVSDKASEPRHEGAYDKLYKIKTYNYNDKRNI